MRSRMELLRFKSKNRSLHRMTLFFFLDFEFDHRSWKRLVFPAIPGIARKLWAKRVQRYTLDKVASIRDGGVFLLGEVK